MRIKMNVNWGAKACGVFWLLEGQEYDIYEEGIPEKEAMMLIGTHRATHVGEADELFGKDQAPVGQPSRRIRYANSNRGSKDAK